MAPDFLYMGKRALELIGIVLTAWEVLKWFSKVLSFSGNAVRTLLSIVAVPYVMPQDLLIRSLLLAARRLALFSVLALVFGAAWWLSCRERTQISG
jgi:hypothetical protein